MRNRRENDSEKMQKCKVVLRTDKVQRMFSRLQIRKLPIPLKLKVLTWMYKYRIGLKILILQVKLK